MSNDWSSFEKDKAISDKWKEFLNEAKTPFGDIGKIRKTKGISRSWDDILRGREFDVPIVRDKEAATSDPKAPEETEETEMVPPAETTYIPRTKWKKFSNEVSLLIEDPKKVQKLLFQMVRQFKDNNIKIGTKPLNEFTGSLNRDVKTRRDTKASQLLAALQRIAKDPNKWYMGRSPNKLKKFFATSLRSKANPDKHYSRFQGMSTNDLVKLRDATKKAAIATKKFIADDTLPPVRRKNAETYAIPILTKFGKMIDKTRRGQTATIARRYGLPPNASQEDIKKAIHQKAGEVVSGKNVVGEKDKFTMKGIVVFMYRNLELDKSIVKKVAPLISKFVRDNTKLKLSENLEIIYEENLRETNE